MVQGDEGLGGASVIASSSLGEASVGFSTSPSPPSCLGRVSPASRDRSTGNSGYKFVNSLKVKTDYHG